MSGEKLSSQERGLPKIELHFMRHSIKAKANGMDDHHVPLSEAGLQLAANKFEGETALRYAHAVGSPRVRTQETAASSMLRTPTSISEIEEGREQGELVGKVRDDERLDFNVNMEEPNEYQKIMLQAYSEGRFIPFLVNESDQVASELADTESTTYDRAASSIASIIYDTYLAGKRGAGMLEHNESTEDDRSSEQMPDKFERFLSTHSGVQECFIIKLIDTLRGKEARDELIAKLGNGFDYVEGFDVILSKDSGEEHIRIKFQKGDFVFDEIVPEEVIRGLI